MTPLLEPSLVHGSGATSQWCWGSKSPCLSLRPHNSQLQSLLALTPAPGLLSSQIPNSRPMICCPTAPCPPVLNPRPPGSKLQQLVLSIAMRCLQRGPSPGLCSSAVTPLLSQAGTWDSTGLRSHPNPQQVGGYSGPLGSGRAGECPTVTSWGPWGTLSPRLSLSLARGPIPGLSHPLCPGSPHSAGGCAGDGPGDAGGDLRAHPAHPEREGPGRGHELHQPSGEAPGPVRLLQQQAGGPKAGQAGRGQQCTDGVVAATREVAPGRVDPGAWRDGRGSWPFWGSHSSGWWHSGLCSCPFPWEQPGLLPPLS